MPPLVLDGTNGVSGVDGTASNPAIEGTDSNTGIFYPAADTVAIGTGGTERLRVDSSGNVGIATTSPDGGLDVEKQNSYFGDTTNGGRLYFRRGVDGSAVGRVGWISGSNVNFEIANDSGSGNILFQTNSAERMRLDASGNLLLGTTTTTNNLRLNQSLAVVKAGSNTYAGMGITGYAGTNSGIRPLVDINRSRGTTDGSMTAVVSGDILGSLIFRGADGTAFQDAAMISGEVDGTVGSVVMPGRLVFYTSPAGSASVTERARITSGGDFLVGTTTATAKLTVSAGNAQCFQLNNNSLLGVGIFTAESTSYATGQVAFNVARSANSAYSFVEAWSNSFGDVEFKFRGDGNGYADGTFNNNGADYAEFFESSTGAALTLGATVVLEGNKVREATDQDPASSIMGVVRPKEPSKASMVVGNTAWNKWANKYLTDDFDRYIMEDHDVVEWTDKNGKQHSYESHNIPVGVTVPDYAVVKTHDDKGNKFQHYKLNPTWNPDAEYVNRENRPEWIIVGLVGQVKVLKGQPVNDRWIKMRDVSETVEEWMIR